MVRSHTPANLARYISWVNRAQHRMPPKGGHTSLTAADYEVVEDLLPVLDAYGPVPQEVIEMVRQQGATVGQDHIGRGSLRAYHARAAELIMQLVSDGWCTVRLQKNSLMLYPIDGSSPYVVHARKDDREWKQLNQWTRRHVIADGHPLGVQPDQMIEKLAAQVNNPDEHPPKPDRPVPKPPPPATFRKPDEPAVPAEVQVPEVEAEPEWRPYVGKEDRELPNWQTDGTYIWCVACLEAGEDWHTTEPKSLGGHWRTVHNRDGLDTPEARAKSTDTRRFNRLEGQVIEAIEFLSNSVGKGIVGDGYVTELEEDNTRLTREAAELRRQLAEAVAERDECQARLALLRDAMGA